MAQAVEGTVSRGHVEDIGAFEYFTVAPCEGRLFRAPLANPIGTDGYRMGGRFECPPWMIDATITRMRAVAARFA